MTRDACRLRGRGTAGNAVFMLVAFLCRSVSARMVGASAGWYTATPTPYQRSHAANLVGVLLSAAPSFASAVGSVRIGETSSSDDDCYGRGSCNGVFCSTSEGMDTCVTCGHTTTDANGSPWYGWVHGM